MKTNLKIVMLVDCDNTSPFVAAMVVNKVGDKFEKKVEAIRLAGTELAFKIAKDMFPGEYEKGKNLFIRKTRKKLDNK